MVWLGVVLVAATIAAGAAAPSSDPPARGLATVDTSAGALLYSGDCAACHGYTGEGLLGAYPPLASVVPRLLEEEGGRGYLIGVMLHGLSGRIEVRGRGYDDLMPSFGHLADQGIADVLNHVATEWGNRELLPTGEPEFTALEVGLARAAMLSHAELSRTREVLTRALEQ